jgi:hypothetical protein
MSAIAVRDKARPGGRVANLVHEGASRGRLAQLFSEPLSVAPVRRSPRYEFEGKY